MGAQTLMGGVIFGFLLAWMGGAVLRGGGSMGAPAAGERRQCTVSIVFLRPDDGAGELIDAATGSTGVSHVVVDACEHDPAGEPLVFDCQPLEGVTRQPWSRYAHREASRVTLEGPRAWELRGCLQGRLGNPYGPSCAALVAECLPGYSGPASPSPAELRSALI